MKNVERDKNHEQNWEYGFFWPQGRSLQNFRVTNEQTNITIDGHTKTTTTMVDDGWEEKVCTIILTTKTSMIVIYWALDGKTAIWRPYHLATLHPFYM